MKKTIEQVEVGGKRVLVRVDFNVPMENGNITDDLRIRKALPTLQSILDRGGSLTLMSHLGRPSGSGFKQEFSLVPIAQRLSELLGRPVVCSDDDTTSDIVLMENLRFNEGEQSCDHTFAERIASVGDIYCNDAFGTAHRNHASMVAVPQAMDGKPKVAGLLLARELEYMDHALKHATHPFVVLLGGAKVSDKMEAIQNLLGKVDTILIGGAMAYTFLAASGMEIGKSLVEKDRIKDAAAMLKSATACSTEVVLPEDHVCVQRIEFGAPTQVVRNPIPQDWIGVDIGPDTAASFTVALRSAKTIIWNGPMGVFEIEPFDVGTRQAAEAIAEATKEGAISIVAGGDSAAAVSTFGLDEQITHISTGGGASLQMLEGRTFPSVTLLDDAL